MKRLVAISLGCLFLLSAVCPGQEIGKTDQKNLVKAVQEYFKDLDDDKPGKAAKTLADMQEDVEKAQKNAKVADLLALLPPWRQILLEGYIPSKPEFKASTYARSSFRVVDLDYCPVPTGADDIKDFKGAFDGKLKVLTSIPKNYKKTPSPVLLVLHDIPEETQVKVTALRKSRKIIDQLEEWANATYPAEILNQCIVVIPVMDLALMESSGLEASRPQWTEPAGKAWALSALANVVFEATPHDPSRLFIDGHGSGALAAMQYCVEYPSQQTGAIVRGPGSERLRFLNCQGMPFMMVGEEVKKFYSDWKEKKGFDGLTHADSVDSAALLQWIQGHPKDYCPEKIEIQTESEAYGTAYWVRITEIDRTNEKLPLAALEARVDRDNNQIIVSTNASVKSFTVYLNDSLLDLDKEIKIVSKHAGDEEGKVRFQGTRKRSLKDALDFCYSRVCANTGEVFVASVNVEISDA